MDFSTEALFKDYNKIIDDLVHFIIKSNMSENNPIEALAIIEYGSEGHYYKCSYITFGWKDRNPEERNVSIWNWWKGEKIAAKIKFSNREESTVPGKIRVKVNKAIMKLIERCKKEQIKNKIKEIETDFN